MEFGPVSRQIKPGQVWFVSGSYPLSPRIAEVTIDDVHEKVVTVRDHADGRHARPQHHLIAEINWIEMVSRK